MKKKEVKLNKIKKSKVRLNIRRENKVLEKFKHLLHLTADDAETRAAKRRMKHYRKLKKMRIKARLKKERKNNSNVRSKKRKQPQLTHQQLVNKSFKDLFNHLKNDLNVAAYTVYTYTQASHTDIKYLMGDIIAHTEFEHYLSYAGTTILVNPVGLIDGDIYKSRMITQLYICGNRYLIVLSSFAMEAFKGKNAAYIISTLRHMKRKTGETVNEHSNVLREEIQKAV